MAVSSVWIGITALSLIVNSVEVALVAKSVTREELRLPKTSQTLRWLLTLIDLLPSTATRSAITASGDRDAMVAHITLAATTTTTAAMVKVAVVVAAITRITITTTTAVMVAATPGSVSIASALASPMIMAAMITTVATVAVVAITTRGEAHLQVTSQPTKTLTMSRWVSTQSAEE